MSFCVHLTVDKIHCNVVEKGSGPNMPDVYSYCKGKDVEKLLKYFSRGLISLVNKINWILKIRGIYRRLQISFSQTLFSKSYTQG